MEFLSSLDPIMAVWLVIEAIILFISLVTILVEEDLPHNVGSMLMGVFLVTGVVPAYFVAGYLIGGWTMFAMYSPVLLFGAVGLTGDGC